ncbi:MAG: hypothetical protein V7746_18070 [Halioglobus sp.]
MIKFIASCWDVVMDNQYNPLRHLDLASQHYLMQMLGGMWSMVFGLTFLSIFHFGLTWIAHVLLFGGVVITVAVFREGEKQSMVKARATAGFSGASRCMWKLDSEA